MRVEESGISPKSNQIEILNEEKTDVASDVQTMATNNSMGQRLTMNVQVEKKCKKKKNLYSPKDYKQENILPTFVETDQILCEPEPVQLALGFNI